jgi:hypothetical protein
MDTNREQDVSPEYDADRDLSHIQSESHTDPAVPTPDEAESVSTSRSKDEDPNIRTKRFRDAA